jgi:hypothetical protein
MRRFKTSDSYSSQKIRNNRIRAAISQQTPVYNPESVLPPLSPPLIKPLKLNEITVSVKTESYSYEEPKENVMTSCKAREESFQSVSDDSREGNNVISQTFACDIQDVIIAGSDEINAESNNLSSLVEYLNLASGETETNLLTVPETLKTTLISDLLIPGEIVQEVSQNQEAKIESEPIQNNDPPVLFGLDTHSYDSKIADRVAEFNSLRENYKNATRDDKIVAFLSLIKQLNERGFDPLSVRAATLIMNEIGKSNLDPSDNIASDDVLYFIYKEYLDETQLPEPNESVEQFNERIRSRYAILADQLAEISSLGNCPQGRSKRLLQIIYLK